MEKVLPSRRLHNVAIFLALLCILSLLISPVNAVSLRRRNTHRSAKVLMSKASFMLNKSCPKGSCGYLKDHQRDICFCHRVGKCNPGEKLHLALGSSGALNKVVCVKEPEEVQCPTGMKIRRMSDVWREKGKGDEVPALAQPDTRYRKSSDPADDDPMEYSMTVKPHEDEPVEDHAVCTQYNSCEAQGYPDSEQNGQCPCNYKMTCSKPNHVMTLTQDVNTKDYKAFCTPVERIRVPTLCASTDEAVPLDKNTYKRMKMDEDTCDSESDIKKLKEFPIPELGYFACKSEIDCTPPPPMPDIHNFVCGPRQPLADPINWQQFAKLYEQNMNLFDKQRIFVRSASTGVANDFTQQEVKLTRPLEQEERKCIMGCLSIFSRLRECTRPMGVNRYGCEGMVAEAMLEPLQRRNSLATIKRNYTPMDYSKRQPIQEGICNQIYKSNSAGTGAAKGLQTASSKSAPLSSIIPRGSRQSDALDYIAAIWKLASGETKTPSRRVAVAALADQAFDNVDCRNFCYRSIATAKSKKEIFSVNDCAYHCIQDGKWEPLRYLKKSNFVGDDDSESDGMDDPLSSSSAVGTPSPANGPPNVPAASNAPPAGGDK
eukprot:GILI01000915.1.p1 GENE.GILI01000915.1~~GILI01000915.1.p1  ORF type:complete len:601 (-),score=193.94 GILI01000915.1:327-2129(-)